MTQNWPARRYKPRVIVKTVAASGTPEALGGSQRMAGVTFFAQNAVGTNNTGNVTIQLDGSTDARFNWSAVRPAHLRSRVCRCQSR